MRISVVIPCYNSDQWIQDALQSVAGQTYQAHEIIVVDDGSEDDSLEQIKSSGIAVKILSTMRLNAAVARNEGIKAATGDWIAFLDADDIWYPHHLECAVSLLEGTNDVAYLAHNDQWRYDENGRPVVVQRRTFPPVDKPTSGLSHWDFFRWYAKRAWFCTNGLVAKREIIVSVGGFDVNQVRRHDFEFFLRVIHGRTWSYNPTASSVYRLLINPNSISSNLVETHYYTLRGLLKNECLYEGPLMRRLIRKWARKTAKMVLLNSKCPSCDKAWTLAWPRLSIFSKFFVVGHYCPWLVCFVRTLKHRLKWMVNRATGKNRSNL